MNAIKTHIVNNIKEYTILILIFIIGLTVGSLVLNNSEDSQREEISAYFTDFTESVKSGKKVDYHKMISSIMKKNIILIVIMTFLGVSIIGSPGLYIIILHKGFSIGYTISGAIAVMGTTKGLTLTLASMFLSKMIELPAIFFLAVSGINSFKSIMQDRRKENIKDKIIKFAIEILIVIALLTVSALLETYLSSNLLISIAKYL